MLKKVEGESGGGPNRSLQALPLNHRLITRFHRQGGKNEGLIERSHGPDINGGTAGGSLSLIVALIKQAGAKNL